MLNYRKMKAKVEQLNASDLHLGGNSFESRPGICCNEIYRVFLRYFPKNPEKVHLNSQEPLLLTTSAFTMFSLVH
jgi:hypothetical protein